MKPFMPVLAGSLWLAAAGTALAAQYVYPAKGQDKAAQARDESECSAWATEQTGFAPVTATAKAATGQTATFDLNKALASPAAAAALGAVAGNSRAGGLSSLAGFLGGGGGSGGTAASAASFASQALAQQKPAVPATPGQPEFDRARTACLTARGYSVQ